MSMQLYGDLWLGHDDASVMGDLRISILEAIDVTGSITQAARSVGVSYKTAWEALDAMKNISGEPLVESVSGGKHGGGSRLTAAGKKLVTTYRLFQQEHRRFLARIGEGLEDFDNLQTWIRRLSVKSSARNQYVGRVCSIRRGQINAEVLLDIGGSMLVAVITNESVEHLGLKEGSEAYAMIKAPWVIVTTSEGMKTSARNELKGTVVRCQEGAVNGEVVIELDGGKSVAAVVTNDSIRSLGLKVGVAATALIKASHIILAVNA